MTTTVDITEHLAQFTACGVIVVDGEPCETCKGAGTIEWSRRSKIDEPSMVVVACSYCAAGFIAPEPWHKLTEPCPTCGGDGLLSNESGDPHCWYCSGEACALCYRAMQTRECDHDLIARHGDDDCRDECPDCVGGRQVVTLTATCLHVARDKIGRMGHLLCTRCKAESNPGTGYCWRPHPGVVTLGRFTIRLLPYLTSLEADEPWTAGPDGWFLDAALPDVAVTRIANEIDYVALDPLPRPGQWVVQFEAAP